VEDVRLGEPRQGEKVTEKGNKGPPGKFYRTAFLLRKADRGPINPAEGGGKGLGTGGS